MLLMIFLSRVKTFCQSVYCNITLCRFWHGSSRSVHHWTIKIMPIRYTWAWLYHYIFHSIVHFLYDLWCYHLWWNKDCHNYKTVWI